MHADATAEFYAGLNDPRKWIIKPGVPIFKPHRRVNPANNEIIDVDLPKLYQIAANMQRLEREGGVPTRGTLGHTEPGKPQTQQPPVALWYRNARVQPFGPKGEPAIVADEWLDPQYAAHRKNYPFRSAEYYDDTQLITGVALLTEDPYLDLGVVAYSRSTPGPVRYSADGKVRTSHELLFREDDGMNPTTPTVQAATGGVPPTPQVPAAQLAPAMYANALAPQPQFGVPQPPVWAAQPAPTPYSGFPQAQAPYGQNIGHQQNQSWMGPGVAAYGAPGMSPPQPGARPAHLEPDGDEPLHQLHHHLTQAAAHLSRYLGGNKPAAYGPAESPMDAPFPQGAGGMPQAAGMGTAEQPYSRYSRQPAQPQQVLTLTGQPVGQQLEVDRLKAELAATNQAVQALMYERDRADGEACAAEIGRLAAQGYMVGEQEVVELKNKRTPEARAAYINTIQTRYQRVGTEQLPVQMGDPTLAMAPQQADNRPATQAEMETALAAMNRNPQLPYHEALRYARNGGQAPAGGSLFTDLYASLEPGVNGHPAMNGHAG